MAEPKPFAQFDVDGTIFKSSLTEKVVEGGIRHGIFKADAFNDVYKSRRRWQENNSEGTYNAYIHRLVGTLVATIAGVEVARFDQVVTELVQEHRVRRFRFPRLHEAKDNITILRHNPGSGKYEVADSDEYMHGLQTTLS